MDESEPDLRLERMDKVSVTWKYKGKMVHSYGLLWEKLTNKLKNN